MTSLVLLLEWILILEVLSHMKHLISNGLTLFSLVLKPHKNKIVSFNITSHILNLNAIDVTSTIKSAYELLYVIVFWKGLFHHLDNFSLIISE